MVFHSNSFIITWKLLQCKKEVAGCGKNFGTAAGGRLILLIFISKMILAAFTYVKKNHKIVPVTN
jgi:hypothetical protein